MASVPKRIPITLDKPRTMLLDFNALVSFEEATGVSPMREGIDPSSAKQLRALIWASLLHEDPNLTLEDVGRMVHMGNMEEFGEQVKAALTEAFTTDSDNKVSSGNGIAGASTLAG